MKITFSALVATLVAVALPSATVPSFLEEYGVTKSECESQGGVVVADLTGEVIGPDYKCANTNESPTDLVRPEAGEPWPEAFEVCCGGTGDGVAFDDNFSMEEFYFMTTDECTTFDGTIEQDNGEKNHKCASDGWPPISNVTSTGTATGDRLGVCCLNPWIITSQDCGEYGGNVVEDSGNGAVFKDDYICASDGFPPIGNVTAAEGAAPTGVCCLEPWILTKEECVTMMQGTVVTDSGDGAVFAPGYMCANNFPPVGQIAESETATPTGVCCVDFDLGWESVTKSSRPVSIVKKANAKAHKKAHSKPSSKKSHQLRGPFW